jgi:hypothetical protein
MVSVVILGGLINVLPRETPCDCMNDDYDKAKKGANTTGKLGKCYNCGKNFPKETLLQCMKCKQVRYCNAECQKEDWSNHREFCEITHKREQLCTLTKKREGYEKNNSNEGPDYDEFLRLVNDLNHPALDNV